MVYKILNRIIKRQIALNKIQEHILNLQKWFQNQDKVIVALSGGVDSCLVAFLARKFLGKQNAISVISHSASLKARDLKDARNFCERYDIQLEVVDAKEIEDENYASNPINRCYFCKTALYSELVALIDQRFAGYKILNGNNYSDFGDYRPGLQAADEKEVLSPLAACQLTKEDIRDISRHYDLFVWDKPASPCLSSRFPYGEAITIQKLRMVEKAEELLYEEGFRDSRVRYFKKSAKIEVPASQVEQLKKKWNNIAGQITALGFEDCILDEEGLISGKLNRVLTNEK